MLYVQILFASCTRRLLFVRQRLLSAAGRRSRDVMGPAGPSLLRLRLESLGNLTLTCRRGDWREHCVQRQGDNDKASCFLIALPITLVLRVGGARGAKYLGKKRGEGVAWVTEVNYLKTEV